MSKEKIIRITTVPQSLAGLLAGQLRFINQYFEVIGISSPGVQLQEVEKNEGIATYSIKMTRSISPLKDLVALWKLYIILKKEKPHIVHTHTPKAGTIGMMAAYLARVPVRIHTVAGLPLMESQGVKRKILNVVEKLTYRLATLIYPNSLGLKQFIIDEGYCKTDKLRILGQGSSNGIDTSYFSIANVRETDLKQLRQEYRIMDDDIVFCFVGRMVGDKGLNELVSAFIEVYKFEKSVKLLLVGTFEKELDSLQQVIEYQIYNHPGIVWVGWQTDVRPFLAIADIFTFPSYREGFPNVVMQAGAMGVPCIVSDINGCNEIVTHELNGLIVPSKDKTALFLAMKELLWDKGKRDRLSINSRQVIQSRYERKKIWHLLLLEYKTLLKGIS